ncbi:MAG TPA: hypothetical protein VGK67_09505 [Myxococcales bacterium]|jgi:hypothetical protein
MNGRQRFALVDAATVAAAPGCTKEGATAPPVPTAAATSAADAEGFKTVGDLVRYPEARERR